MRYAKKELEPISIKREDDIIHLVDVEKPFKNRTYKDWTIDEHRILANTTIPAKGYDYKEMIEDIQASQAVGISYAKNIIKVWIAEKIISKKQDKKFYYNPKI